MTKQVEKKIINEILNANDFSTLISNPEKGSEITLKDLKKVSKCFQKEEKPIRSKLRWFSRLMNRFGWHRKYEILVIDSEKIKTQWFERDNHIGSEIFKP